MLAEGGGPRVFLAGVNHLDPLGRERLVERLGRIADDGVRPEFAAVEYDPQHFSRIVDEQRPAFRRLLKQAWPDLDDAELDLLELSLGYEGDAHRAIFPKAEVVWLDQGREEDSDVLETFARDTVVKYRWHLGNQLHGRIGELSAVVTAQPEHQKPGGRDEAFAAIVLEKLESLPVGVVVVGGLHVDLDVQGTMAQRLVQGGVQCVCV